MNLLNVLLEALRALNRNRVRATLTALGIIIGVGAVIATGAVGAGAKQQVTDQIATLGSSTIMIFPASGMYGGVSGGAASGVYYLELSDIDAIDKEVKNVKASTPMVRTNAQVVAGSQNWSTQVQGADEDFIDIRAWPLSAGENFAQSDIRNNAKVAVLGQTVVDELFPDDDPIGQTIRVKKVPFKVIGVLSKKGQNTWGMDQDDIILAPYSTVMTRLRGGNDRINNAMVSAESDDVVEQVSADILSLLKLRHRVPDSETGFNIRSQTDIMKIATSTSGTMSVLLGAIAGISLVVGGIGIMNIMLVSVAERTREIGLRIALGARRRDIRWQFLLEASFLSLGGGLIGVILGTTVASSISKFVGWTMLVTTDSVLVAVLFSAAVGVFFGFYPAQKAASANPIEALRYE
ncbi:MAG: ABC transporter permease [bacterium]|nr:ABC transporter permease [bacterium]